MPKILIIDDDRRVRDTIKLVMEAAGYTLAFASNGREGLARFAEFTPDLVITDILMPEKEGIATITELRKLSKTLPIIAISGGGRVGNMDFLKVAQNMGATKTLSKPFDPDELIDTVAALLPKAA
jgi:DNA-binding response OmpR family regulator